MSNALSIGICVLCGKDSYRSRRAALVAARQIVQHKGGRELRPYRCESGAIHLTRQGARRSAESRSLRDSTSTEVVAVPEIEYGPAPVKRKVVSIKSAPSKQPGPERTSCSCCGRLWLSDIWPGGRRCVGCGAIDSYVIGQADQHKDWKRVLAA